MLDIKLKRCPFCGSRSVKLKRKPKFLPYGGGAFMTMFVYCKHCGSSGKELGYKIKSDTDPVNTTVLNKVVDSLNTRVS